MLKFNTSDMVKNHCAEGRCQHSFMKNFPYCRKFKQLCKSGSNPTNCPYYDCTLDYKK